MDNRRVFARRQCNLVVYLSNQSQSCVGDLRDVSLGGLLIRVPQPLFQEGERLSVTPQDEAPLEYEICWAAPAGAGFEMGLSYPHSIAGFWNSWAADLLAGARPTHSEMVERRSQVRLPCLLEGTLSVKGHQRVVDILDIGAGGALIEMDTQIDETASHELSIESPMRVGHLPCRVVRAWPGEPALYGLEFTDLRERHRLAIVRLLNLLYRQST